MSKLNIESFVKKIVIVTLIFMIGVFVNRDISTTPTSLGIYFEELSNLFPDIKNTRFPQRLLLPFISYITGLNVQILNIFITFIFIFHLFNYLLEKQNTTTSFLVTVGVATTMIFQFHITYGGYPDALSLFLYLLCIKNICNKKFYIYALLSLFTREAAIVMFPILYLIKKRHNNNEKILLNLSLMLLVYLPFYFLVHRGVNNANGWEFYLLPLLNDPMFWFDKSTTHYWLGFFSALKFLIFLLPLLIKSKKDFLLIFISFISINIQFLVSGGDNTRYWLIFIIPIVFLLKENLKSTKFSMLLIAFIISLNIITPKYYVFTDANEGNMYVTPNDSRLHIFDIYSFFNN